MAQGLARVRMRARAASIQLFICNSIGLGLGPLIVGWASDLLHPIVGSDSLRYALMAAVVATLSHVPHITDVITREFRQHFQAVNA